MTAMKERGGKKTQKRGQAALVSQGHIRVLQGPNFSKQQRPRLQHMLKQLKFKKRPRSPPKSPKTCRRRAFLSCEREEELGEEPPQIPTRLDVSVPVVRAFGRGGGGGVLRDYSPSSSSFTSLAAFSPSSLRFLSIIFDLSAAALSS